MRRPIHCHFIVQLLRFDTTISSIGSKNVSQGQCGKITNRSCTSNSRCTEYRLFDFSFVSRCPVDILDNLCVLFGSKNITLSHPYYRVPSWPNTRQFEKNAYSSEQKFPDVTRVIRTGQFVSWVNSSVTHRGPIYEVFKKYTALNIFSCRVSTFSCPFRDHFGGLLRATWF